ncbi:MAG TPA: helix-turn-helix domain-containing protein [Flavobacterium sp.]|jgi:transcriptional regulator GlxA family with amidase domain
MKHISILVPNGHTSLPNIDGAHQILSEVNNLAVAQGNLPPFHIELVGISEEIIQRNGRFVITTDKTIDEVDHTDLIIIPAIHSDLEDALTANAAFFPWIRKQYENGAEVASMCIASFFLAATGLLDGKQCATHWHAANQFRLMFPNVDLVDDKILTHEDGIYTSGGAYSFLNLLVYLVEKYCGRDMAIMISKIFMIDIDKDSQSPFIMFSGQKDHEDEPVKKAQVFIEENFEEKLTVDALADRFALGRRSFERRFKKSTGNSVIEYIQRVKIEAAKKQLETGRKTISEVMYDVGYTDAKAFRDLFKRISGMTPVAYRNKYNKDMMVMA